MVRWEWGFAGFGDQVGGDLPDGDVAVLGDGTQDVEGFVRVAALGGHDDAEWPGCSRIGWIGRCACGP
jgi:hypothetical protein